MAEMALACLIRKFESLRPDEVAVLRKMNAADVFSIYTKLEQLQYFQRQSDLVDENSLELEILVKDLREAAQESEDVVDNFLLHLARQRSSEAGGRRIYAFLKSFLNSVRSFEALNGHAAGSLLRRIINHWSPAEDIYSSLKEIKPKFLEITGRNQKILESMGEKGLNHDIGIGIVTELAASDPRPESGPFKYILSSLALSSNVKVDGSASGSGALEAAAEAVGEDEIGRSWMVVVAVG